MANQYFPLLPKLKENSAVTPDKVSIWEDETYDFLDSLIKSLAVSGDIQDIGSIDSIPDVWARPLLFEMALFDKQNRMEQQFVQGLHNRVVGEWRCLLAMLALNDIKHLNLRAEEVRIGDAPGNAGSMERILRDLAPNKSMSNDTDWNTIYVIFYQDVPLAMSSPTTLLAVAADYMTAFSGSIPQPWSNNGIYLSDPIPYLTEEDLCALYTWLQKLRENLSAHVKNKVDNEAYLLTMERIEDYCRAIEQRYTGRQLLMNCQYNRGWLKLNAGVFREMDFSVQAKAATAEDSQVRLVPTAGREPAKHILLLSPDMLREVSAAWDVPQTQLIVWPGITANDITEDKLYNGPEQIGPVLLKNTEYRRPEEFFTEYMAVMEPGNALKNTMRIRGEDLLAGEDLTAILPLRREILEYFSTEDIANRLTIEDGQDEVLVHFAFPLSGNWEESREYDFVKHYPKKDLIYLQKNVPIVEIWPNIRREGWDKYYLYYENADAQNTQEAGKDFFYVKPWTYGVEDSADVPKDGMANRYTAKLNGFPDVLLCTVNSSVQGNVRSTVVETGMVLLALPPLAEVNDLSKWQIGIDFGTSSTMIYYKENHTEPKPLSFASHLSQVTESGAARTNTYLNFIPSTTDVEDGSFLSIFHLLNTKKMHDVILPLQDGHIFPLTIEHQQEFIKLGSRVDANLKWQAGDTGRYKATSYLEQICMQSAVEAALNGAAEIKWNFSYPAAFSDEERESFRKMCLKAIQSANEGTCFKASPSFLDTQLESVATALHFNKLNSSDTNFGDGAVCLDIGAGTTDISIISGRPGRIVYHSSIRFAGRYLFRPIYSQYQQFFGTSLDLGGMTGEQRTAVLDADMRRHSDEYLEALANLTGNDEVKGMLEQAQAAMAGIFYYVGRIFAKLKEKGIYTEDHVPDIYVGGNGSRVFYWLTGGGLFDSGSVRMRVLKKMMLDASGFADSYNFDIYLSDKPKIEVASGMVEERPRHRLFDEESVQESLFGDTEDEYVLSSVLCGEEYAVQDVPHLKDDFVSARDISAGLEVRKLDELWHFLEVFNGNRKSIWLNGIALSDEEKTEIQKRVYNYYIAEKGKDIKEIHVEPVFIQAMKKMMEMLAHE